MWLNKTGHLALLLLFYCARAIDFSFLSDKELLLASGLAERGSPWATGPFTCATLVDRKCASTGPRYASSPCGEAQSEGAPGLPPGGRHIVHGDTYNRSFIFFACADMEGEGGAPSASLAEASLAARGSVLARVGASRGAAAAAPRPRSVWAQAEAPRSGWGSAGAALPALPEERASPCAAERATRVVCAQTEPRQGGGGGFSGSASAPWGTRCTCLLRATGGQDEAPFSAN